MGNPLKLSVVTMLYSYLPPLCSGQADISAVDTFGDGLTSFGSPQKKKDFATLSNDPIYAIPSKITICSSLSADSGPRTWAFFQLKDDTGMPVLSTQLWEPNGLAQTVRLVGGVDDKLFEGKTEIIPMRYWYHACTSFDSDSGHALVLINGKVVIDAFINPVRLATSLADNLVIGNLWIGGKLWYTSRGKVANLNIYSGLLTMEAMIEKTSGSGCGMSDGDYLSWSQSQWRLEGAAAWTSLSVPELCKKESSMVVFSHVDTRLYASLPNDARRAGSVSGHC